MRTNDNCRERAAARAAFKSSYVTSARFFFAVPAAPVCAGSLLPTQSFNRMPVSFSVPLMYTLVQRERTDVSGRSVINDNFVGWIIEQRTDFLTSSNETYCQRTSDNKNIRSNRVSSYNVTHFFDSLRSCIIFCFKLLITNAILWVYLFTSACTVRILNMRFLAPDVIKKRTTAASPRGLNLFNFE